MSDSDELDMDGGESPDAGGGAKKKSGLAAILPTILKFAAIGIAALIFIVTVSVVTYNIMNSGGKSQTVVMDSASPYVGKRPIYATYTGIGTVTTKTRDENKTYSVNVVMKLGYEADDAVTATELNSRQDELKDFVRHYFSGKYASELKPENEARLKQDIRDVLNNQFLDSARVRLILFDRLDTVEIN